MVEVAMAKAFYILRPLRPPGRLRRPMPVTPTRTTSLVLAVIVLAGTAAGCRSRGDVEQVRGMPDTILAEARKDLRNNNYDNAVTRLEALEARYPFSEQAKQGQLELLYAYYKNREPESAIDQADQFIRENPTHPRVDYAHYINGLVYFEGGARFLERLFHVDIAKRPPQEARQSLQSFQTLVQQYPKSPYAADAHQRMVYLRNKLADYELAVARYYMKRGAFVGAANRARGVIETYDGAPATLDALAIMAEAYRRLGIDDMAVAIDGIIAQNTPPDEAGKPADKPWWRFGF
jgi:outer membrane protein assembly factor BamD